MEIIFCHFTIWGDITEIASHNKLDPKMSPKDIFKIEDFDSNSFGLIAIQEYFDCFF